MIDLTRLTPQELEKLRELAEELVLHVAALNIHIETALVLMARIDLETEERRRVEKCEENKRHALEILENEHQQRITKENKSGG